MTVGELSQLITAIAAIGAVIMSWRNGRKIEIVRHATNSMKDELVQVVRKASIAEGRNIERTDPNAPADSGH